MKVQKIIINGFKKFEYIEVEFNENFSVLVGENEVGKSTILKAVDIVLNQKGFYQNENTARYFNTELTQTFFKTKEQANLPKIDIELFLDLEDSIEELNFNGFHYNNNDDGPKTGIKFTYEYDDSLDNTLKIDEFAENKVIPTDYYKASWYTFQGKAYVKRMCPLRFILLDHSVSRNDLFGGYARQIYNAKITDQEHRKITSSFKKTTKKFVEDNMDYLKIDEKKHIGFDSSKSELLKLLDIYETDISIQDMGKGKENMVKTEMSINQDFFDVVLIDEPENHLSYSNTRSLIDMITKITRGQIIISSHSSLIVNRLNLQNAIILGENKSYSLSELKAETAKYFYRLDNLDILRFILAKKVILVEGASEYILLPAIFNLVNSENINQSGVDIISMGSISFRRYKELSDILNKKTAVITDNDGKIDKIYPDTEIFKVFTDTSPSNWTLEVAYYNSNKCFFDDTYENKNNSPMYKKQEVNKQLAYMLKNKTENAILIEDKLSNLKTPEYLIEAVKWINE